MSRDILIVGGGVIGLAIARELHKRGARDIVVADKGICGSEASWAAAGMLGPQAEGPASGAFFDMCCSSRDLYPQFAAELHDETGIDIELDQTGTLYLAFTAEHLADLRTRFEDQRKSGLAVELLSAAETCRLEPFVSPDVLGSLFFPGDWQVNNRQLCNALAAYARINDIEILEGIEVERLIVEDGRITAAGTSAGRIEANHTVLATGAWTSLIKLGDFDMPLTVEPVRGQMIAFHTAKQLFRHVIYSPRGYIVPRADGRIIAGSTTEKVGFDKTVTTSAETALREMACEIAPSLLGLDLADSWAGLRPRAIDSMPVIGPLDGIEGIFVATAHYRNGILLAPVTAKLAAAHLIDEVGSFAAFGAGRFRIREVRTIGRR